MGRAFQSKARYTFAISTNHFQLSKISLKKRWSYCTLFEFSTLLIYHRPFAFRRGLINNASVKFPERLCCKLKAHSDDAQPKHLQTYKHTICTLFHREFERRCDYAYLMASRAQKTFFSAKMDQSEHIIEVRAAGIPKAITQICQHAFCVCVSFSSLRG